MYRFSVPFLLLFVFSSCQKEEFEQNKVPTVNAGASQTITLPVDSVKLTGSGADADGKVVAYLWSQVSGPAATRIVNPGATTASITGFVAGNYVFQLMVTDDMGATGVDTVAVTVNPALEQTLTLQPVDNPTEATFGITGSPSYAFSHVSSIDLPVQAWTINSDPFTVRIILKFDLSSIPANATIVSANLYLYSYPKPTSNGNLSDANFGTDNTMLVQQVTANWTPTSINYYAPPATSTSNQVVVPHTNQTTLDLNLNVKPMVSSMVAGNANYGFMLKLQNETTYNSRIFVSSHNTTYTAKHPKLVVVYK